MKKMIYLLMFLGILSADKSLLRIYISNTEDLRKLVEMGVDDILRVDLKKGFATAIVESGIINSIDFDFDLLDPDLTYRWQRMKGEGLLVGFGPYYTYDEATSELDNIHQAHPEITTEKISIGITWEGRDIWAMKISDNPDISEGEPTVLFVAVHHAREPIGCSILLDLAWRLTENYGDDPEITWLVDNREIWIVPIVNPDGYTYNEVNSDGMWRKNKRDNNGNGVFEEDYDGVDLNRNYSFMWGYDDFGSSPDPSSNIYRGPSPFSEPETQAIRDLSIEIEPDIVVDYHSYSNVLLFPWSYDTYYTPDDNVFRSMSELLTEGNGYPYGTVWEILYTANGVSLDWHYGDTSKPSAFGFSPEVGEWFWQPDTSTIVEQIHENLPLNLTAIKASGLYLEMDSLTLQDQSGNPSCDPGDTINLFITLLNLSPKENGYGVEGKLMSLTSAITVIDSISSFGDVDPFPYGTTTNTEPFKFVVGDSVQSGVRVPLLLELNANNGEFSQPLEFYVWIGEPLLIFYDDFEEGLSNWTIGGNGNWTTITSTYHSPNHSITDSPVGNYGNNWFTYITLSTPLVVSDATYVILEFWHRYDFEEGYDYGMVQISDDGINWFTVKNYTGTQYNWEKESIDVTEFIEGDSLYIRFLIETDTWITADGWYIDDISIFSDALVEVEEPLTFSFGDIKFSNSSIILKGEGRRVRLILPNDSDVKLNLYDVSGRRVEEIARGRFSKGSHVFKIETVRSGIYFLRLETERKSLTRKVVILR
jgi:hypothetical protein